MSEPNVSEQAAGDRPADEDYNVRIDDVTKVFRGDGEEVVAVEDLSIDIRRGEFLVFVGPSGCGKTTTLRTVAGLEEPTEGRIMIEGIDVTGLEPRERGVAMVFQNYALYPHMSVRENLSFPLEIRNYPDDEVTERVDHAAGLLEISELLDRKPSELSGGQQQRVALGRAIVREPSVFLMDEPLSNLDAKLRVQMRTELNEIHNQVEKTTIYVTHDQAEAMTLGDRVVVLDKGKLQQIAPPQTLYDEPANRFVAGFIGEPPMNFVSVDVTTTDGRTVVSSPFFELDLPDRTAEAIADRSGSYTFGIRPEDLYAVDTVDGEWQTIEMRVRVVEPMGSDIFLTMTPPGDESVEFTARVSPEVDIEEGDLVELAVDPGKGHLFDDATGENVTR
jgi:multiple sugar transport system ATP-binding protein